MGVPGPSQDEFNALSGQVTALNDKLFKDLGTLSISDFETAINTQLGIRANGESFSFRVILSGSTVMYNGTYTGIASRGDDSRYNVILQRDNANPPDIYIGSKGSSWYWDRLALGSKMSYTHKSGSSTYLTSYHFYYVHCGNLCTFVGTFVPNQNISNSIGDIDNCGLPKPLTGLNYFPVGKVDTSFSVSDVESRFAGVSNISGTTSARFKAVGAYTSGVTYSFSGSYVTENTN